MDQAEQRTEYFDNNTKSFKIDEMNRTKRF